MSDLLKEASIPENSTSVLKSIFKLPQEVLTLILRSTNLTLFDLRECMLVCKQWYSLAKTIFYQDVKITENTNVELFLHCLARYGFGDQIINLSISYKSKRSRNPPFRSPDETCLLISSCPNIKTIKIKMMNPYFILRGLENEFLPKLERINICWQTCDTSKAVKRHFYAVNHIHRSTIKYINMPGDELDTIVLPYDDLNTLLSFEQFMGFFAHLKHYSFNW